MKRCVKVLGGSMPSAPPRAGSPPLFQMTGISQRYGGVRALEGVDLTARAGRIIAVLGENGAGKSSLIQCLAGVVQPHRGGEGGVVQPQRGHLLVHGADEAFGPHRVHPHRGGGVVGVEGGEEQVSRERGVDRDGRGLSVADFSDEDDVRVLADERAESLGEGQLRFALHGFLGVVVGKTALS